MPMAKSASEDSIGDGSAADIASVRRHSAVLILPSGETDLATMLTSVDPDLMTP